MKKVGETLYDLRIVESYDGQQEKEPLFSGAEGFVVWSTWDTGDWQILLRWKQNGEYLTEEVGVIADEKIEGDWTGKQTVDFIKTEIYRLLTNRAIEKNQLTCVDIAEKLLEFAIVTPRNNKALQHISKTAFNLLVDKITEYINQQIEERTRTILEKNYKDIPIAIDIVIASTIQLHDHRHCSD